MSGTTTKRIWLTLALLRAAIQFVPLDTSNPVVEPARTIYASKAVPANVRAILEGSCKNCHSNDTYWPWYSHVAPASWIIARDVHQGRSHMNLSEWRDYSPAKQEDKLERICSELMTGEMPDGKYTLVHRRARLTQEDRNTVCAWVVSAR